MLTAKSKINNAIQYDSIFCVLHICIDKRWDKTTLYGYLCGVTSKILSDLFIHPYFSLMFVYSAHKKKTSNIYLDQKNSNFQYSGFQAILTISLSNKYGIHYDYCSWTNAHSLKMFTSSPPEPMNMFLCYFMRQKELHRCDRCKLRTLRSQDYPGLSGGTNVVTTILLREPGRSGWGGADMKMAARGWSDVRKQPGDKECGQLLEDEKDGESDSSQKPQEGMQFANTLIFRLLTSEP